MSEPVGWNVYDGASAWDITRPPRFREFIPNEAVLGPVAEKFAGDVEAFAAEQGEPEP